MGGTAAKEEECDYRTIEQENQAGWYVHTEQGYLRLQETCQALLNEAYDTGATVVSYQQSRRMTYIYNLEEMTQQNKSSGYKRGIYWWESWTDTYRIKLEPTDDDTSKAILGAGMAGMGRGRPMAAWQTSESKPLLQKLDQHAKTPTYVEPPVDLYALMASDGPISTTASSSTGTGLFHQVGDQMVPIPASPDIADWLLTGANKQLPRVPTKGKGFGKAKGFGKGSILKPKATIMKCTPDPKAKPRGNKRGDK